MDVRAMEDHDWDECGDAIAKLHQADEIKGRAIADAWWDTDEDDQYAIHEVLCEQKRDPTDLEKARDFEKRAAETEKRLRKMEEERKKVADRERVKALEELKAAALQWAPPVRGKVSMGDLTSSDRSDGWAW